MCLLVKEVPDDLKESLIIKGIKLLEKQEGLHYTYIRNTLIPADGWLFPENRKALKRTHMHEDRELNGGVIHMYTPDHHRGPQKSHIAYGFGILAYGAHNDVAVRALYIPDADHRLKYAKQRTQKLIDRMLDTGKADTIYHLHSELYYMWALHRHDWPWLFPRN